MPCSRRVRAGSVKRAVNILGIVKRAVNIVGIVKRTVNTLSKLICPVPVRKCACEHDDVTHICGNRLLGTMSSTSL